MSIQIILDNYHNVCYPGQTLAGRVECNFDDEEKLRAIRIRFKGLARTKWSESRGSGKSRRTVHFHGEEEYFSAEYNLLDGGEDFRLPAGRYVYPFAYILPPVLPSSCDLGYGRIYYKIKANVDRPWKFDYETEFLLKVQSPIDLNYLPQFREPVMRSVDKEVGCMCTKSGPVRLDVSLASTGFTPGQPINAGCYVQNLSNVNVSKVKFRIRADFQFIATSPHTKTRCSEETVCKYVDGAIGAHAEKSWTANFEIPRMEFVNLVPCHIINYTYTLEVCAVLPCPHTNLTTEIPIMIGDIPLVGVPAGVPGPPGQQVIPQFPGPAGEQVIPQFPAGYQLPPLLNPTAPAMPMPMPYGYEDQARADNSTGLPTYAEASTKNM